MINKTNEPVFTKEQLINANEFYLDKDIIAVLIDEDKTYTKKQVRELIKSFRAKEVE